MCAAETPAASLTSDEASAAGRPRERRIGFYGGSFDPPHNAHLALARLARDHLALDELRIVPAGQPWQKQDRQLASAEHRSRMVALMMAGEPRLVLDDTELRRPGPHYTVDTLRVLRERMPGQWYLVVGQDQYEKFDTWRDWPELLEMATLAVAGRAGSEPRPGAVIAAHPHQRVLLPLPPMALSSSKLRARVARGESIAGLVPPAVASYIDENHLYRS